MIKITPKEKTKLKNPEKYKKIIYWILLGLFLPISIYLLAVHAYLMFFLFAGTITIVGRLVKKIKKE